MVHSLVHLSDLHFGARGAVERGRALVERLLAARPGTVLVTGDVTDAGRLEQWRSFRETFAPLEGQLVLLPGNHDRGHDDVARLITGQRVWTVRRPGLHLVCVDSTAAHNRVRHRAHGSLCERAVDQVAAALALGAADAVRVIALHHHLLPLPVEGLGEWFAELFGWPHARELPLGLRLLRRALGACDLVLHGHRHKPREAVIDAPNGRPLHVLNAGATLELGACRWFEIAPGAWSHRWLPAPLRRTATAPSSSPTPALPTTAG